MTPTREFHLLRARVYLAQVPVFRNRRVGRFHFWLLNAAGKARCQAAACSVQPVQPVQRDLFGAPPDEARP